MPLVVDLDGTLIRTDVLHESALRALRDSPAQVLRFPLWLAQGKATLKERLARLVKIDPISLPYNIELVAWLKAEKAQGRKLILCTASDASVATAIAEHLSIFDEVIASNGIINLAGPHKAAALTERFGHAGFDYVGNSNADIAVWRCAHHAVVVDGPRRLARAAEALCPVERVFLPPTRKLDVWARVLRVHQWLKNMLLFVPLFASHDLGNLHAWKSLILAFLAFSLCASSVYIANDLMDLESDRQHPRKRLRPFASGQVPAWMGIALAPFLLLAAVVLAIHVDGKFLTWLGFYFGMTCAYSFGLKRLMLVDSLVLALLYTVRIIAGAAAAALTLTFWLLAFSIFLFLSLAFVKRYAELAIRMNDSKEKLPGRGYYPSDASLIQTLGIGSGYGAVLLLSLYLNSNAVLWMYKTPEVMWAAIPVLLFWISWMWTKAHRGEMHDDPLIFAVKDRASQLAGVAFAAVLALGSVRWPW